MIAVSNVQSKTLYNPVQFKPMRFALHLFGPPSPVLSAWRVLVDSYMGIVPSLASFSSDESKS